MLIFHGASKKMIEGKSMSGQIISIALHDLLRIRERTDFSCQVQILLCLRAHLCRIPRVLALVDMTCIVDFLLWSSVSK